MLIGLHDADRTRFPNYALMKISAWHKARDDTVEWWNPMKTYDHVYSSKLFSYTPVCDDLPPDAIKGGTGYGEYGELTAEVDACFPDYSIYPDVCYAIGFLTRGCIRRCPWCIVPRKEGIIRPYRTWREIKRPDSRDIVLMDNNILACRHGVDQLQSMISEDVRIDINQGLDARLITPEIAAMLGRLKWIRFVRLSCDTDDMLPVILDKARLLNAHGIKNWRLFVYVLVRDIPSAERRCIALRDAGMVPFAQPYRDFTADAVPTPEQAAFARWVNRKAIFMSVPRFSDYISNRPMRG